MNNIGTAAAEGGSGDSLPHHVTCKGGGGFGLDHVCDAVFLDLPKPWLAFVSGKRI